jgi:hypothetical protein
VTYLTDRKHLASVIQDGIRLLLELEDLWLSEDAAACAPRSAGIAAVVAAGSSSPVETMVVGVDRGPDLDSHDDTSHRYKHRDRLGSEIWRERDHLSQLVDDHRPHRPVGLCSCCHERSATHGPGRTLCDMCAGYYRRMGHRCGEQLHADRGRVVMCSCPPECCEVCGEHATVGQFSERCADRIREARTA